MPSFATIVKSYDKQASWGGMIGIGNNTTNMAVSFSQRGDTSISGSLGSKDKPAQLSFSHTTNGSTTIGVNYNQGLGDRNGLNIGANYDLTRGETSGTVGFTDRESGLGINANINRNGLSTSVQYLGTNLGTMTANGYQANEINWMEQNINAAQDKQQNYENKREKEIGMKLLGKSEAEYDAMTPEEKEKAFDELKPNAGTKEQGNIAADTSRKSFAEQFFGGVTDSFRNSISIAMGSTDFSSTTVEFKDGKVHVRTCFTAGTKIHTETGLKVIEDIQIGDVVLSWNEETGENSFHKVVKTFQREVSSTKVVLYNDGSSIETTDEHPFYIKNKGWVSASNLVEGDLSVLSNNNYIKIISVTDKENIVTVYNFEVETSHIYFVGEQGILVHNECIFPNIESPHIAKLKALEDKFLFVKDQISGLKLELLNIDGDYEAKLRRMEDILTSTGLKSKLSPEEMHTLMEEVTYRKSYLKNLNINPKEIKKVEYNGGGEFDTYILNDGTDVHVNRINGVGNGIDDVISPIDLFVPSKLLPLKAVGSSANSGLLSVFKIGKTFSVVPQNLQKNAAKTGLTNPQLVQKSATLAERAIGGQGPVAGIAKHKYANQLLDRYQKIYGYKGHHSFNNGVGNRGILDVLDRTNRIIYDFKFGKAVMSPAQYNKYYNNFGLPIQIIRP